MSTQPNPLPRIGDAERDDAVALLRDHMAAGRLGYEEFDERLGQAMQARTQPELDALFTDLPGRRPGQQLAVPAPPSLDHMVQQPPAPPRVRRPHPWWTHWGLFAAAIALSALSRGELGPLVPIAAVWCFFLGPSIAARKEQRELWEEQRRRELGR